MKVLRNLYVCDNKYDDDDDDDIMNGGWYQQELENGVSNCCVPTQPTLALEPYPACCNANIGAIGWLIRLWPLFRPYSTRLLNDESFGET